VKPRLRFAPSPTGSLHLGNARTALFNWLFARREGGAFVLRIEDTDTEREQEGSEAGIVADLRWLGLDWDEGPDRGGPFGPYRQSERSDSYRAAADRLLASGLAYPCFCTDDVLEADRAAQRAANRPPRYSGRCRAAAADEARTRAAREPHAVRFRIPEPSRTAGALTVSFVDRLRGRIEFPLVELGDPVLLRRDGRPTYNFAVVVDDAAMDMTLVLRGDDHLSNTPRQVLLFEALGHAVPEFAHLPMVRGPDGERLSKRHGATSVAECRRNGFPPEAVVNAIALLGWSPPGDRVVYTLEEMKAEFDLARVSRSPGIFDPAKLDWISGQHIHQMPEERVAREVAPYLAAAGRLPDDALARDPAWMRDLGAMLRGAIERFDQAPERTAGLFFAGGWPADAAAREAFAAPAARAVVEGLERRAKDTVPLDRERWKALLDAVKAESGAKGKALFQPIRAALTGSVAGPELDQLVPLAARGASIFPDRIAPIDRRAAKALAEWR